jgi:hypothetical protein
VVAGSGAVRQTDPGPIATSWGVVSLTKGSARDETTVGRSLNCLAVATSYAKIGLLSVNVTSVPTPNINHPPRSRGPTRAKVASARRFAPC